MARTLFQDSCDHMQGARVKNIATKSILYKLVVCPRAIERRFISDPEGTTWAEATLRMSGFDTPRKYYVNAVQLVPKKRPIVWTSFVTFQSPLSKSFSFPFIGRVTMELTIAQFWSSGSGSHVPATAEIEIQYHSLLAVDNDVSIKESVSIVRGASTLSHLILVPILMFSWKYFKLVIMPGVKLQ